MKNTGMMSSHPGKFIKQQVLEPLDLTISHAAEIPGRRRATLSD
jgi:plasmid maintenance system antidote protein VapI